MKVFYNAQTNDLFIPEDRSSDVVFLLGLNYIWFYIGEL